VPSKSEFCLLGHDLWPRRSTCQWHWPALFDSVIDIAAGTGVVCFDERGSLEMAEFLKHNLKWGVQSNSGAWITCQGTSGGLPDRQQCHAWQWLTCTS
jgi:hypothetical protein